MKTQPQDCGVRWKKSDTYSLSRPNLFIFSTIFVCPRTAFSGVERTMVQPDHSVTLSNFWCPISRRILTDSYEAWQVGSFTFQQKGTGSILDLPPPNPFGGGALFFQKYVFLKISSDFYEIWIGQWLNMWEWTPVVRNQFSPPNSPPGGKTPPQKLFS